MANAYQRGEDAIRLYIRVTPNAPKDAIAGLWRGADDEERLALRVAAPPDKGRANAAAGRLVAKALGLAKSAVEIVAGEKDRLKTLAIRGDPGEIAARLDALLAAAREKKS